MKSSFFLRNSRRPRFVAISTTIGGATIPTSAVVYYSALAIEADDGMIVASGYKRTVRLAILSGRVKILEAYNIQISDSFPS
jgi:hypothetical protein